MSRSRRRFVLLVALAAVWAYAGLPLAAPTTVARVVGVEGEVELLRGGQPLTLYPQFPLASGDLLVTREGRAIVRFDDGSEMRVRPRGRLAIRQDGQRREIDVFFGRLWAFVAKQKDQVTNFRTGGTLVAVRGTTLEYGASRRGKVDTGVSDGGLEVSSTRSDGSVSRLSLEQDFRTSVEQGERPSPPAPFKEGDIADAPAEDEPEGEGEQRAALTAVQPLEGNNPFDPQKPAAGGSPGSQQTPTPGATRTPRPTSTPRTPTPTPSATLTPTPTSTAPVSNTCLLLSGNYSPFDTGCGLTGPVMVSVSGDNITVSPVGVNGTVMYDPFGPSIAGSRSNDLIFFGQPGHTSTLHCGDPSGSNFQLRASNASGGSCQQSFGR